MYHLVWLKRVHPGAPDPDLMFRTFEKKVELLEYAAENHISQRGPKGFMWFEGGEARVGGLGDLYDEIEKEKIRNTEELLNVKA